MALILHKIPQLTMEKETHSKRVWGWYMPENDKKVYKSIFLMNIDANILNELSN